MVKFLCYWLCRLFGWKIETPHYDGKSACVIIGAPHTSNWDFFPAMAVCHKLGVKVHYAIKKEWMKFPVSLFFKFSGGIGINRKKKEGDPSITDQLAEYFKQDQSFRLMIAPEGTRKPRLEWRTGFYYVAQKAQVPILVCKADYQSKFAGSVGLIELSDVTDDMKKITELYRGTIGRNPEKFKLDERYS